MLTGQMPIGHSEIGIPCPDVSILIVAYNSRDLIRDCIGSIITHTKCPYEILLIDNGPDGTADLVCAEFPQVQVLPSQGNIGFGRANNALATAARADLLLLLNPDTRLIDPAIDRLVAFARRKSDAGAWGGLTMHPDGTLDGGNFLSIPTVRGLIRSAFIGKDIDTTRALLETLAQSMQVEVLCGGFMMLDRTTWDQVEGFDPSFLLYSEEIDLFARMARLGLTAWITPECRIEHNVGSGSPYSISRIRYSTTGAMHFARRHWRFPLAQIAGLAIWLQAARRYFTSALLSHRSSRHQARRKAYGPVVWRPWQWWNGYRGKDSLD